MISDKEELESWLYLLRSTVADGTPEGQAAVQASTEATRAFIEKLKTDYPDKSGLFGGLIAALECAVQEMSD
ncbi:hypothetical protein EY403_08320 [Shigella sonnei]|nr:hypothetical protein [Escherichia coli]EFX1701602.1 hypothetical protein [Shigella sonnei]EEZ5551869.1 hypothetical protein [Escherichia coli]EFX1719065.1 hypothetical protein [Shigella sonnei]EFX2368287.1 hypothetical protein [Shigella sonnei]